jgi:hypothetical protein
MVYSWNKSLHVSDSSFVHHQEFFTVHTASIVFSGYRGANKNTGIKAEERGITTLTFWHQSFTFKF